MKMKKKKRMWADRWPWERCSTPASDNAFPSFSPDETELSLDYDYDEHNFAARCLENEYPDVYTKIAAIQASASVVSVVAYRDGDEILQGTGTIIDEDGSILTSADLVRCHSTKNVVAHSLKIIVHLWDEKSYEAQLLAVDFYYGIAVVKIQEKVTQLKPACLKFFYDSLDSSELQFRLRPHSNAYSLIPGDKVIALGRNFVKPYVLMAAPGQFSIRRCSDYNKCKELFKATCLITEIGKGGPLINCHGEVIGVASYDFHSSPFLPINVALKWWEHYKKFGRLSRPSLGTELANLYTPDLYVIEKVTRNSTNNFVGVTVEEVIKGSSADIAGLCPTDIIVQCCGKAVSSFLELFDMIWDNIGNSVELSVIRTRDDSLLHLIMNADDALKSNKRKRE